MAQITVHRALTQLKTLDAQIQKATHGGVFMAVAKGDKQLVVTNAVRALAAADVKAKIERDFQSVTDLIKQRAKLKSSIVASNAATVIDVAGVKMTVAEAIERKASIGYEENLLAVLRSQLQRVSAEHAQLQGVLDRQVEDVRKSLVGKDTGAKITDEQLSILTQGVERTEKPVFLDPLNITAEIEALEKRIQDFLQEVDSALNESNAITRIEV